MIYTWRKGLEYGVNLGTNVGGLAHLSFQFLITCGNIYNEYIKTTLGRDQRRVVALGGLCDREPTHEIWW